MKYEAGDELASYSSPIITHDRRQADRPLLRPRRAASGFDPQTGKRASTSRGGRRSRRASTPRNPVVVGDQVLITECYGPGAALLELKGGKPKEIWTDEEKDRIDKLARCATGTRRSTSTASSTAAAAGTTTRPSCAASSWRPAR